jgi:hypothetical protein
VINNTSRTRITDHGHETHGHEPRTRTRNMSTRANVKVQGWKFQENWKTSFEWQGTPFPEISSHFGSIRGERLHGDTVREFRFAPGTFCASLCLREQKPNMEGER